MNRETNRLTPAKATFLAVLQYRRTNQSNRTILNASEQVDAKAPVCWVGEKGALCRSLVLSCELARASGVVGPLARSLPPQAWPQRPPFPSPPSLSRELFLPHPTWADGPLAQSSNAGLEATPASDACELRCPPGRMNLLRSRAMANAGLEATPKCKDGWGGTPRARTGGLNHRKLPFDAFTMAFVAR